MIRIPYPMGKRPWGKNSISPPQKAPHFPRCGTRPKKLKSRSNKNDWENSKVLFWSSVEHWFDLNMFGSFEHVRGVFSGGLWGTKLPHGKPRKLINTRLACFGLLASSDWQLQSITGNLVFFACVPQLLYSKFHAGYLAQYRHHCTGHWQKATAN